MSTDMPWQYEIVEFCIIPFIGYLVLTQFIDFFQQFKGNCSLHIRAILTKCEMHMCYGDIYGSLPKTLNTLNIRTPKIIAKNNFKMFPKISNNG